MSCHHFSLKSKIQPCQQHTLFVMQLQVTNYTAYLRQVKVRVELSITK